MHLLDKLLHCSNIIDFVIPYYTYTNIYRIGEEIESCFLSENNKSNSDGKTFKKTQYIRMRNIYVRELKISSVTVLFLVRSMCLHIKAISPIRHGISSSHNKLLHGNSSPMQKKVHRLV